VLQLKQQVEKPPLADALSDYHLLVFLASQFDSVSLEMNVSDFLETSREIFSVFD